jgi:hypothetical protein
MVNLYTIFNKEKIFSERNVIFSIDLVENLVLVERKPTGKSEVSLIFCTKLKFYGNGRFFWKVFGVYDLLVS